MNSDLGLLILRVFPSAFMLTHGWAKLVGFNEYAGKFPGLFGLSSEISLALAIGSEFFGAILVILGIATRISSLSLLITMLVAGLLVHAQDPFAKKELALLYAAVYAACFVLGSGKYALGHKLSKNKLLS